MAKRSGVTAPAGFRAGGMSCGVKKDGAKDLALIVSDHPAVAWGVFTKNRVVGAPVTVSRAHMASKTARLVVANSGNSNTYGKNALENAKKMARAAAKAIGCAEREAFVASTGVIGQELPIGIIEKGVDELAGEISLTGGGDAAEAIMTTDLVKKECSRKIKIGGKTVTVGGCAKGSGMIHPNMATMLAFLTTDAAVSKPVLKTIVKKACDVSFNRITVDGDTSTSDMFIMMANGASGAPAITKASGKAYDALLGAVTTICVDLAKKIARDGEGATKFITVKTSGMKSEKAACDVAMSIAKSPLVKTAMFGRDANWGRIIGAAGNAGHPIDLSKATLKISGVTVFKNGAPAKGDWEAKAAPKLEKRDVTISLDFSAGKAGAEVWTCDLTCDYIRINADYRS